QLHPTRRHAPQRLASPTRRSSDLPKDTAAVEAEIMAEVKKFHETLVDPKQLADTKSAIKYSFLMGMETAQDVAFALMQTIVATGDRKSTRLNSSHVKISYAVFCLT